VSNDLLGKRILTASPRRTSHDDEVALKVLGSPEYTLERVADCELDRERIGLPAQRFRKSVQGGRRVAADEARQPGGQRGLVVLDAGRDAEQAEERHPGPGCPGGSYKPIDRGLRCQRAVDDEQEVAR